MSNQKYEDDPMGVTMRYLINRRLLTKHVDYLRKQVKKFEATSDDPFDDYLNHLIEHSALEKALRVAEYYYLDDHKDPQTNRRIYEWD